MHYSIKKNTAERTESGVQRRSDGQETRDRKQEHPLFSIVRSSRVTEGVIGKNRQIQDQHVTLRIDS